MFEMMRGDGRTNSFCKLRVSIGLDVDQICFAYVAEALVGCGPSLDQIASLVEIFLRVRERGPLFLLSSQRRYFLGRLDMEEGLPL